MKSFSATVRPAPAKPMTVATWLGGPTSTSARPAGRAPQGEARHRAEGVQPPSLRRETGEKPFEPGAQPDDGDENEEDPGEIQKDVVQRGPTLRRDKAAPATVHIEQRDLVLDPPVMAASTFWSAPRWRVLVSESSAVPAWTCSTWWRIRPAAWSTFRSRWWPPAAPGSAPSASPDPAPLLEMSDQPAIAGRAAAESLAAGLAALAA